MNQTTLSTGNRRWMLVDDNSDILAVLSALVEDITSATVECHDSPESALAAYQAAPDAYELVITDFDMPGMNGMEFCRRLHELSPGQKVFLATGSGFFGEASARHHGFSALLHKPFPMSALQTALATVGIETEYLCAA